MAIHASPSCPWGFAIPDDSRGAATTRRAPNARQPGTRRLLAALPAVELTLLVGMYAQAYYLERTRRRTLTATVENWRAYLPRHLPTPHPSWRTTGWQKRHPWFEAELLPELRLRVGRMLE